MNLPFLVKSKLVFNIQEETILNEKKEHQNTKGTGFQNPNYSTVHSISGTGIQ